MISKACYVTCDNCGNPAPVATEGAKQARRYAREEGYTYVAVKEIGVEGGRRTVKRDLCGNCRHVTSIDTR